MIWSVVTPFSPSSLAEDLVLLQQRPPLGDAVHEEQELFEFHGFGDVVQCPGLHRIHGRLDRPIGRDDDDVDLRIDPFDRLEDLHSVHPRHLVIEEDQVIVPLPDPPDRLIAVFGLADGVALLPEEVPEHLPLRLAVFHNQNVEFLHSAFAPLTSLCLSAGSRISKVVPSPLRLRTRISPPCPRMISWARGSPSPSPFSFVVYSGLKIRSTSSVVIPHPVSVIRMLTRPFSGFRTERVTLPSPLIDSIAFLTKLRKACWSLSISIGMTTGFASPVGPDGDPFCGGLRGDQIDDLLEDLLNGAVAEFQLPALREGEKLLDDPVEAADLVPDHTGHHLEFLDFLLIGRHEFPLQPLARHTDRIEGIADLVRHPGGKLTEGGEPFRLLELPLHLHDPCEVTVLVVIEEPHRQQGNQDDQGKKNKHVPPVLIEDLIGVPSLQPEADDSGDLIVQTEGGDDLKDALPVVEVTFRLSIFCVPSRIFTTRGWSLINSSGSFPAFPRSIPFLSRTVR